MKDMKQFKLWISADLKDRIERAAKQRGWSANREAVYALSAAFPANAPEIKRSDCTLSFEDRLAILKAGIRPGSIEMSWLIGGLPNP